MKEKRYNTRLFLVKLVKNGIFCFVQAVLSTGDRLDEITFIFSPYLFSLVHILYIIRENVPSTHPEKNNILEFHEHFRDTFTHSV